MTPPNDINLAAFLTHVAERALAAGDPDTALHHARHAQALLDKALAPARRDFNALEE